MTASEIIEVLNKVANNHFANTNFSYHRKDINFYVSSGDRISKAINFFKNSSTQVNVVKWFDSVWIYSTIEFSKNKECKVQAFSFSVFIGTENDLEKKQLFRAEWDFFEDNYEHPQPHWHFYTNREISYLKNTFAEIVEEESRDFLEQLSEERSLDSFPIEKFHFAMNAKWADNLGFVNDYNELAEFSNWFDGLLGHIRSQILYASK